MLDEMFFLSLLDKLKQDTGRNVTVSVRNCDDTQTYLFIFAYWEGDYQATYKVHTPKEVFRTANDPVGIFKAMFEEATRVINKRNEGANQWNLQANSKL
jgi:hypothetical protein